MTFVHGNLRLGKERGGHRHDVHLVDDGTLDTVIVVDGREVRFSSEDSVEGRNARTGALKREGLQLLAEEACEAGMLEPDAP